MPDNVKIIAERLVRTRKALGITQAELCRSLKIAPNRWNQYETGERRITIEVAAKLYHRHGITLDWIYVGDPSGLPQRLTTQIHVVA